jgi:hypothetical protein
LILWLLPFQLSHFMNTNFTPLRPFFFFALLICSLPLVAQPPAISYQSYITGLSVPVDLVNAGDGTNRLFIVEQAGTNPGLERNNNQCVWKFCTINILRWRTGFAQYGFSS